MVFNHKNTWPFIIAFSRKITSKREPSKKAKEQKSKRAGNEDRFILYKPNTPPFLTLTIKSKKP